MIRLICIGKIKDKHLTALIDDYTTKIRGFERNFKIIELPNGSIRDEDDPSAIAKAMAEEGKSLVKTIDPDALVVLLDLHGQYYPSEAMAKWIDDANMTHQGKLDIVIAGSYGYDPMVISRANIRWKLSENTFLHTIVRLLAVEQIYRGLMIKNHRKYHK